MKQRVQNENQNRRRCVGWVPFPAQYVQGRNTVFGALFGGALKISSLKWSMQIVGSNRTPHRFFPGNLGESSFLDL
jgi:hypothetical protein